MGRKLIDITGRRFGRLVALSRDSSANMWSCVCDCGKRIAAASGNLRKLRTQSCGCLASELTAARNSGPKLERRGPKNDLTGNVYGRFTVKSYDPSHRRAHWICECSCGNVRTVEGTSLRRGNSTSCGCYIRELTSARNKATNPSRRGVPKTKVVDPRATEPRKTADLVGMKFGRLTVVSASRKPSGEFAWDCLCECGNTNTVASNTLLRGRSRSCGCLSKEAFIARNLSNDYCNREPVMDLTGQRFGRLVVTGWHHVPGGKSTWLCSCDCGGATKVKGSFLKRNLTRSCGCLRRTLPTRQPRARLRFAAEVELHPRAHDLSGRKFGKLTAVHFAGKSRWYCACDCGGSSVTPAQNLRSGNSTSCGCVAKEKTIARNISLRGRGSPFKRMPALRSGLRIDSILWSMICQSWGNQCAYCSVCTTALTQDHVRAITLGGQHTLGNIVPACRGCNVRKLNLELGAALARLGTKDFHKRRISALVTLREMINA